MAVLLVFIFTYLSKKVGLIDIPNTRKPHAGEIPLIGGLVIVSSYFLSIKTFNVTTNVIDEIILGTFLVSFFGLLDDLKPRHWSLRVFAQLVASVYIIHSTEISINHIASVGYFNIHIPEIASYVLTLIAILGITNAINLLDGIDGLASGIIVFPLLIFLFVVDNNFIPIILILLINVLVFLKFNLGKLKQKIFLGDAGSLGIGFFLGWLLIVLSNKNFILPEYVIWIVAIPILDTFGVMYRRYSAGLKIFEPDNRHIHHILIKNGYTSKVTLQIILISSIVINLLGLYIVNTFPQYSYFCFILVALIYYYLLSRFQRL